MSEANVKPIVDEIKEEQRRRRVRARQRNMLIGFFVVVISVLTLLLVINLLVGGHAAARFAFMENGRVEQSERCSAVVLQTGEALLAPSSGIFVPFVVEGGRVPKGEMIGVMLPEAGRDLLDQALALRAELVRYQLSDDIAASDRMAEAYRLETRSALDAMYQEVRQRISIGDTYAINDYASLISQTVKPSVLDEPRGLETIPEARDDLDAYQLLLNAIVTMSTPIVTEHSGLVIYRLADENLLAGTSTGLALLTPDHFASGQAEELSLLEVKQAGDAVATLLTSTSATMAVYLENHTVKDVDTKTVYGVALPDETKFTTVRFDTVHTFGDGVLVTFLLPTPQSVWRETPHLDVNVRFSTTDGLVVPLRSLLDYDEADGIAILQKVSSGQIQRVPVFVLGSDGRRAVIEGRRGDKLAPVQFDLYVTNPSPDLEGTFID